MCGAHVSDNEGNQHAEAVLTNPRGPMMPRLARRGGPPEVIRGHCASWILVKGAGGWIVGDVGAGGDMGLGARWGHGGGNAGTPLGSSSWGGGKWSLACCPQPATGFPNRRCTDVNRSCSFTPRPSHFPPTMMPIFGGGDLKSRRVFWLAQMDGHAMEPHPMVPRAHGAQGHGPRQPARRAEVRP